MKISVIIPVYNAESYLKSCIDSVLSQTYSDFELILVDDGSIDNSGVICDTYALKDSRIRVVHKKNSGAGEARNTGIKISKGEYLVFVDSDDRLSEDYFERLSKHDEDVVFIDVDDVDDKGNIIKKEHMSDYRNLSKMEFLRRQMIGSLPWGGVRKCVKRSHITNNNIYYSNHKIGEEAIYSYKVLRYAKTIGFIEGTSYYCLLHNNSLSQSKIDDPLRDVALTMRDEVKIIGEYKELAPTVNAFIKVAAAVSVFRMAQNYSFDIFRQKAGDRLKAMWADLDKNQSTDIQLIRHRIRIVIMLMERKLWIPIWLASRLKG